MTQEINIQQEEILDKELSEGLTEIEEVKLSLSQQEKKSLKRIWYSLLISAYLPLIGLITLFITVLVAHVKKYKSTNELARQNYSYAIRTVWFMALWNTIAIFSMEFTIGYVIFAATGLWYLYRVIRGLRYVKSEKLIYTEDEE